MNKTIASSTNLTKMPKGGVASPNLLGIVLHPCDLTSCWKEPSSINLKVTAKHVGATRVESWAKQASSFLSVCYKLVNLTNCFFSCGAWHRRSSRWKLWEGDVRFCSVLRSIIRQPMLFQEAVLKTHCGRNADFGGSFWLQAFNFGNLQNGSTSSGIWITTHCH